jgi:MFS family permease
MAKVGDTKDADSHMPQYKHPNMILWIMGFSIVLVLYVHTSLTPALPSMVTEFNVDYSLVTWTLTAYLVSGAAVTIVIGRLADLYGAKKMLLIVFICYTVGVILAPFAQEFYTLIGLRILQGIAVALVPICIRIAREVFGEKRIPMAQGVILSMYQGGSAVGLVLGALVVALGGWQGVFLSAIPFSLILLFLLWKFIPTIGTSKVSKNEKEAANGKEVKKQKFTELVDIPGLITLVLTISSFMLTFTFLGMGAEGATKFWTFLIIAVASLAGFLIIEKRSKIPLVNLKLTFSKIILLANMIFLMLGIIQYLIFTTIPTLGQTPEPYGLGMDTATVGLLQLPQALLFVVLGPIVGFIAVKRGNLRFIVPGAIILTIGMFALLAFHDTPLQTAIVLLGFALGGIFITLVPNIMLHFTPKESTGVVSATNATMRIIGGAIGPVISGVFLTLFVVSATDIPGTTDPIPNEMAFNLVFLTGAILSFVTIILCILMRRTAIKMGAESEQAKPNQ